MSSRLAPSADRRTQSQPRLAETSAEPAWARLAPPLGVCLFTAVAALLPPTVGSSNFYLRGDSDAQFMPTWHRLGELVRDGYWPPVLDPASWHGGNYAAEALLGVYNPINALNWIAISAFSNLAQAATAFAVELLVLLALGVYLLCREYGAARWAASIVAVAAPFAGFTLYWEAASWVSGLIAFTYLPYAWWALRRVARRRMNALIGVVVGALTVTQGNPYGVLGLFIVGIGLLTEFLVNRDVPAARRLVLSSMCVACFLPLVFWPILVTAPLAHRGELAGISNSDFMSPNLGDLLGLSSPTFLPGIDTFGTPMSVPVTYFSWLVLPLLPWLRWAELRSRLRLLLALPVVAGCYLVLVTGPTVLWLFRWPVRLTEYLYLPLGVALAVALTQGFSTSRFRARAAGSAVLVGFSFYLAWAQRPELVRTHLTGLVVVAVLTAGVVYAVRRFAGRGPAPLVAVAGVGTLLVLTTQVHAFPINRSAGDWSFPHDLPSLRERFDSYTGTTAQFADLVAIRNRLDAEGSSVWRDFLGGSLYHAVGVDSVNTYSGVGLEAFTNRLCMNYDGDTCERGYRNLWKPVTPGQPDLAELMKVDTVVVDPSLVAPLNAPPGWQESRRTSDVVLLHPDSTYPWPDSRLSWVSPGVTVASATSSLTQEVIELADVGAAADGAAGAEGPDGGGAPTLVFARLGWPGYEAEFDGRSLEVSRNSVGLLQVELPEGAQPGTLVVTFRPPGFLVGLALSGLGLLGGAALAAWPTLRRRRVPRTADGQ